MHFFRHLYVLWKVVGTRTNGGARNWGMEPPLQLASNAVTSEFKTPKGKNSNLIYSSRVSCKILSGASAHAESEISTAGAAGNARSILVTLKCSKTYLRLRSAVTQKLSLGHG